MASETLRRLYRKARSARVGWIVGKSALSAWRAAQILRKWEALESMGLVRLRAELDTDWEAGCDCGVDDCPNSDPESEAFGSIGEFCLPYVDAEGYWQPSEDWQHGDSCWGHVGYRDVLDWRENCYILDIMDETIAAFATAWKDHARHRCATCHRPLDA